MLTNAFRSTIQVCALTITFWSATGCSDDTSGDDGTTGPGASGPSSVASSSSGAGAAGAAGGAGGESTGPGGAGGEATAEYSVLFRGKMFSDDLAQDKAYHDMLASGAEAGAKALGDFGHDAMLGTTILGTTENEFLAVDRWATNDMDKIYSTAEFKQGLGGFFDGGVAPEPQIFVRHPEWVAWGDPTTGDAYTPHYFAIIRGRLKGDTLADEQAAHDAVAKGGKDPSVAAGDVAHVPHVGRDDVKEFLSIDIWKSPDNIEAFYSNPQFQQAFGAIFENTPTISIYVSTDWYQW